MQLFSQQSSAQCYEVPEFTIGLAMGSSMACALRIMQSERWLSPSFLGPCGCMTLIPEPC